MDLSELSPAALKLIAKADVEAKYILRSNYPLSGLLPNEQEELEGENQAALHLFNVTAAQLWARVRPDRDAFKTRLDAAKKWVDEKFQPAPEVLNDAANGWLRRARKEAKLPNPEIRKGLPPGGALTARFRRQQQALREGRLEEYIEVPATVQALERREVPPLSNPLVRLSSAEFAQANGKTESGFTANPGASKKRGRPQKIPNANKERAAELKAAGGSNKEAAAAIYGIKYPTPQQTKNVPSILKHHRSKQSGSPVPPRKRLSETL